MTDMPAQIGPYRVEREIGRGGMGVVYLARDTELDRDVAIKAVPLEFAEDHERLARFEREAKTLASLKHSNIAGIYGVQEQDGQRYLILEFVEGETLGERIERGPIPVDEAIELAIEIAAGVEAAHEADVIHRDLKPDNIKITPDGQLKVLDFGLAKSSPAGSSASLADSPTLTAPRSPTIPGTILGTAAYMSPEQAKGRAVDRRADVWSFGCVLYECLAGRRAFPGASVSEILAEVLKGEPDWSALPPSTPPGVRRVLRRCLVKDPRDRLRDLGDARLELTDAEPADVAGIAGPAPASRSSRTRGLAGWIAAAVLLVLLVGLGSFAAWQMSGRPTRPVLRSEIGLTPSANISGGAGFNLTLLSGGHRILYLGGEREERKLWVRDLSQLSSYPISGTEGADIAAVSPDEQWFAFFADNSLKKISVNGGEPIVLAETTGSARGGSWSDDGYIYYSPGTVHRIMRVSEDGGQPETVTDLIEDGAASALTNSHRWPQVLPGGKAVLYLAGNAGDFAEARIELREIASAKVHVLQTGVLFPRYFDGHIGFIRDGVLTVMGFDASTLTVTSPPVPVVPDVYHAVANGAAQYSVSDNGTLIYIPGLGANALEFVMEWMGQDAPATTLVGPATILHPRFSPDGQKVAYTAGMGTDSDIYIYDVDRGQSTRFTLDSRAKDRSSVWSPDGKSIAFASNREGGAMILYRKPVDGSGVAVRLTESNHDQYPTSWSSDGRMLLFMQATTDRSFDTFLLRLDGNGLPVGEPEVLVSSLQQDVHAVFSPDDRFIAYVSDEPGKATLYVRSLDGTARWQISKEAGWGPRWVDSGRLYFHAWQGNGWQGDGVIRSVDFTIENGVPLPGQPKDVLNLPVDVVQLISTMFDVHPIDERLLVISSPSDDQLGHSNPILIQDWVEDLKDRARP